MEQVLVKAMCVLPKTEPGHLPIYLPHNSLWLCSTGHQHRSKLFSWCGYGQWLLASSGRRGGAWKTGIPHPRYKSAVESDSYGGPKHSSNIFSNEDEATNVMGFNSQITWFEKCCIKIIFDCVLLYGHTAKQLLAYFRTVLDTLKHHCATLKLKNWKWFQDRCEFVGMDVAAGGAQPTQSKIEDFPS